MQQLVTPEGATINIYSDAVGWTAEQIYDLLKPNAYQLDVIGPTLTIGQIVSHAEVSAKAGEPPQMQLEQLACQAVAAPRRRDRDGEDFRFAGGKTRHDEPDQFAAGRNPLGDDIAIEQKLQDFVFTPAAPK